MAKIFQIFVSVQRQFEEKTVAFGKSTQIRSGFGEIQ